MNGNIGVDTSRKTDWAIRVLLALAAISLCWLIFFFDRLRENPTIFDRLQQYQIADSQLASGSNPDQLVILVSRSQGVLNTRDGITWGYAGASRLVFDARGSNASELRSQIVSHLNRSEADARDLIFHSRLEVQFATLEAISHFCSVHSAEKSLIASHVWGVVSDLSRESDPHLASLPLVCLRKAGHWSLPAFAGGIQHEVAFVRVEAMQYFRAMLERLSPADVLDAMEQVALGLQDPDLGARYWRSMTLKNAFTRIAQAVPAASPVRPRLEATQRAWLDGETDSALQQLQEEAIANHNIWSERISLLRSAE
jgi:hypothetical protein